MWFHLELRGMGYKSARAGVAVSDTPLGPFRFVSSSRINAGSYRKVSQRQIQQSYGRDSVTSVNTWWTSSWYRQIERGMFMVRDLQGGQMARDMTIFIDDDGKAYHIYASEDNLTLHIAELTDDYLRHTGLYVRVAWASRMKHRHL